MNKTWKSFCCCFLWKGERFEFDIWMPVASGCVDLVFVSKVRVPTEVNNAFDYVVNDTLSKMTMKRIACSSVKTSNNFGKLTSLLTKFVIGTEAIEDRFQVSRDDRIFRVRNGIKNLRNKNIYIVHSIYTILFCVSFF